MLGLKDIKIIVQQNVWRILILLSIRKKETCRKRYGSEYLMGSDYYKKKIKKKQNFNDMDMSIIMTKKKLNEQDWGDMVENGNLKKQLKIEKETNLKKYGVEKSICFYRNSRENKENKFGKNMVVVYNQQNPEIRKRSIEARRKKYGKLTIAFKYNDNRLFDSSWELAYYIWL